MITTEHAATWFEWRAKCTSMPATQEMFKMAAAALREKIIFDGVVEMTHPAPDSQYRLKNCDCGSSEVVYLHCKDGDSDFSWRVLCLKCKAQTISAYPIKHDAQIAWNTGAFL